MTPEVTVLSEVLESCHPKVHRPSGGQGEPSPTVPLSENDAQFQQIEVLTHPYNSS